MDELLSMFLAAQTAFAERVHAITEAQWRLDTPDAEWSVADLVAHLIDENRWAPPLLHGLDLDAAGKVVAGARPLPVDGGVGSNFTEAWDEASLGARDAFTAPGALDRSVSLSRGPTPVRDYLGEMVFDHLVHAWDLGRAIGHDAELPGDVVETVYSIAKGLGDLSPSGMFDPPVSVPEDASTLEKLIALTGRDPR